jgi:hypothetical protein
MTQALLGFIGRHFWPLKPINAMLMLEAVISSTRLEANVIILCIYVKCFNFRYFDAFTLNLLSLFMFHVFTLIL